ncbi:MAG: methyl-accepting chemotaxis protein [Oscillospiraceae bacterium]|jgi:methyl-accepting chemotaxis protein|nr:methyl-accepting chemotaxis protein [Oscillospiraceae bacterium]
MKNLKIAQKLIISFLIVAILAAAVGVVGIVAAQSLTSSGVLLNDRASIGIYSAKLLATVYHQRAAVRGVALYTAIFDDANAKNQITDLSGLVEEASALIDSIDTLVQTDATQKLVDSIIAERVAYGAGRDKFLADVAAAQLLPSESEVGATGSMEAGIAKAVADYGPIIDAFAADVTALADFMDASTDEQAAEMATLSVFVTTMLIVFLVIALGAAIFLAIYISNLISKPILIMQKFLTQAGETGNLHFNAQDTEDLHREMEFKDEVAQSLLAFSKMMRKFMAYGALLENVAAQDLTVEVTPLGDKDTIGVALKTMVSSLNDMFGQINTATGQVTDGSKQISDSAQALAQGSTQQAAAVQQLSSSINEIAEKTKTNAKDATHAAELTEAVRTNAEKGSVQMSEMIQAVQEISDASQNIQKVIKVIDDLAFQTNILALNAAVEAARAGSAGKGFAVVAEEVRNLAAKSAAAASDTSALIENSMSKAELGAKIASETSASLNEIVEGINESTTIVEAIATASEEQRVTIEQINTGIDQVAQVVQQNSATSQESAATAEELSAQSDVLEGLIGQFKLSGASGSRLTSAAKKPKLPAAKPVASASPYTAAPSAANFGSDDGFGKY